MSWSHPSSGWVTPSLRFAQSELPLCAPYSSTSTSHCRLRQCTPYPAPSQHTFGFLRRRGLRKLSKSGHLKVSAMFDGEAMAAQTPSVFIINAGCHGYEQGMLIYCSSYHGYTDIMCTLMAVDYDGYTDIMWTGFMCKLMAKDYHCYTYVMYYITIVTHTSWTLTAINCHGYIHHVYIYWNICHGYTDIMLTFTAIYCLGYTYIICTSTGTVTMVT